MGREGGGEGEGGGAVPKMGTLFSLATVTTMAVHCVCLARRTGASRRTPSRWQNRHHLSLSFVPRVVPKVVLSCHEKRQRQPFALVRGKKPLIIHNFGEEEDRNCFPEAALDLERVGCVPQSAIRRDGGGTTITQHGLTTPCSGMNAPARTTR